VVQFGWAVMNACEPQRAERGDVVGDYREHRLDLTGGLVDRTKIGKWVAEHLLVGGQRQLDGIDGVVLIRGRLDVKRVTRNRDTLASSSPWVWTGLRSHNASGPAIASTCPPRCRTHGTT